MSNLASPYREILNNVLAYLDTTNLSVINDSNLDILKSKGYPAYILRAALNYLEREEYILEKTRKISVPGILPGIMQSEKISIYWEIGPKGIEHWHEIRENLLQKSDNLVKLSATDIPAADRFVPINHNSDEYISLQTSLYNVVESIRGSNDLFSDAENRLIVVSEILTLQDWLKSSKVRVSQYWEATRITGILGWLSNQVASAVVREASILALTAVVRFFGFG